MTDVVPAVAMSNRRGGLRRDVVLASLTQVLNVLSGISLSVVAARTLSREEIAALSWALSAALLVSAIGAIGTPQASVPFIKQAPPERRWSQFIVLLAVATASSTLCAVVWLVLIGPLIADASGTAYTPYVGVVSLLAVTGAAMMLIEGAGRAFGRFGVAALVSDWTRRTLVLGALLVASAVYVTIEPAPLVGAIIIAEVVLVGTMARRLAPPVRVSRRLRLADVAHMAWSTAPFTWGTVAALTIPQAGIWLAALVTSAAEVADLSFAVRLSLAPSLVAVILNRVLAPRVAGADDLRVLQPRLRASATISSAFAVAVVGVYAFAGDWLLGAMFGAEYRSARLTVFLMSLGPLMTAVTGPCGLCLTNRGHQRFVARASVGAMAVYVVASLWLGAVMGSEGVALGSTISMAGLNLVLFRVVKRRLGVSTAPGASVLVLWRN